MKLFHMASKAKNYREGTDMVTNERDSSTYSLTHSIYTKLSGNNQF